MTIRRVALIFDNRVRPDTTGVYCRRALGRLVEVEHFLPDELAQIPRTGFDLYLNIDDGLRYRLPRHLRPAAWWAIDTHLDLPWYLEKGTDFDLVSTAQRDGAELLSKAGIAASWLPLACDEQIHTRHDVPKQYDVCFVGHLFSGARADLVALLQQVFRNSYVGQAFFEDMARTYSQSKVVFNRSIRNDINMRVFEALACGSLLVTNDLKDNGLAEYFQDGVHLATYGSGEELVDKVRYYLARDEIRERVAARGRAEALEKHTYVHRMAQLLGDTEQRLASRSSAAPRTARPEKPLGAVSSLWEMLPPNGRRVLWVTNQGFPQDAVRAPDGLDVRQVDLCRGRTGVASTSRESVRTVEELNSILADDRFDAVICDRLFDTEPDTLEWLMALKSCLTEGGHILGRFRNAAHLQHVEALLAGYCSDARGNPPRWTRIEATKLLQRAGLFADQWLSRPGPGYAEWDRDGRPPEVRVGNLWLSGLPAEDIEAKFVEEYWFSAEGQALPTRELTSIVLVTHNQWPFTRQCLESIRAVTDEPYELIVVDNASTDETLDQLRGCWDVRLIANSDNRGFPAAANQGISAARGKQLLLLNNDTLVTTGWLRNMLDALAADEHIGLVGPVSNCVSGEQQVEVTYTGVAGLDGFAWNWAREHSGELHRVSRLVGFCLLVRRALVDRIGLLDERFGIGNFEDDDYCRRALDAGFGLVVARDSFVHHFGSQTFMHSGMDLGAILEHNLGVYEQKWGAVDANERTENPAPAKVRSRAWTVTIDNSGALRLNAPTVHLSLCMIVRDSAATLPACLQSIAPWVDEMIVVDTGSLDDTPQIAERLGARVYHFPWCDSFATARNESLRHARGDWIFWMDSDDTIEPLVGRRLKEVAYGPHAEEVLGYICQVHCPSHNADGHRDVTAVDHVKLFRNRPELRFEGRIHEQILPAIRRAGGEVAWTDLYVVHSGSDLSPEGQKKKHARDLRLLELEREENPNHPFVWFNLGMTFSDKEDHLAAVDALQRCLELSSTSETHVSKAYALLIGSLEELDQVDRAVEVCAEGRRLFPDDPELLFRYGVLAHRQGRLEDARDGFSSILNQKRIREFSSLDLGVLGYKAHQNLAVVLGQLGCQAEAADQWECVAAERPDYHEGWRGWADSLLALADGRRTSQAVERMSQSAVARPIGLSLHARAEAAFGNLDAAEQILNTARDEFPEDQDVLDALGHLYFQLQRDDEATEVLVKLSAVRPTDGAVLHNLGVVWLRNGNASKAAEAFRRSLELRPGWSDTVAGLIEAQNLEAASGYRVDQVVGID